MNEEKQQKFYQAKIEQFYKELDLAQDMNADIRRIHDITNKILAWEECYKSEYGHYHMIDENRRVKR